MSISPRGRLVQASSVLLTVLLVGCGSNAGSPSVAPEPTATAAPTATPTPIPTPSIAPSPSESAAFDAAAGLSIASPYELVPLDEITVAAIDGAMEAALGELGSAFEFGYRTVTKSGEPVSESLVMVMDFGSGSITSMPGFLESVAGGIAGTTSGSVETKTILDHPVALIKAEAFVYAAYQSDAAIVVVLTPNQESSEAIVTALITASE